MNKEQQDKLWNKLSEESKEDHRQFYEVYKDYKIESYYYHVCRQIEKTFGSHNLNPEPQIKTWDDVEKYYKAKGISTDYYVNFECGMEEGIADKMIATAKIAKLIELGYGGRISSAEWEDDNCRKYTIEYYPQDSRRFVESDYCIGQYRFIAFHTPEQRDDFMSHESNRKLVKQYNMM